MTMTDTPLSPENRQVLAELERAEGIPGYGENSEDAPPAAPPEPGVARRHYKTRHCDVCGKDISSNNFAAHQLKQHGIGRKRPFKPRASKGMSDVTKPKPKPPVVYGNVPVPSVAVPSVDDPLTVDGILATLVELRWPHTMPTKKVLEMVDLRVALEKFLT